MIDKAVRWSGLLLIAGSVLFGAAIVIVSLNLDGKQPQTPLIDILLVVSSILLLLSFPGMYANQANTAGWLGLAGFALLQIGILLPLVAASPQLRYSSYNPPGGENAVDGLLAVALTLGLLLTGFATFRAGVFPRWAGILLLAATAGFFFAFFVAEILPAVVGQVGTALLGILLAFAFTWIGIIMLKRGLPQGDTRYTQIMRAE